MRGTNCVDGRTDCQAGESGEGGHVIGDQVNAMNYQVIRIGDQVRQTNSGAYRIYSGERRRICQDAGGKSGVSAWNSTDDGAESGVSGENLGAIPGNSASDA
jgi:hypothetical protein